MALRCAAISPMDSDLEQRIRERAFRLWENAGYPEGRAEEFWLLAEKFERGEQDPEDKPAEPMIANAVQSRGFST